MAANLCSRSTRNGRSGGIRTHDPQSPRLMRYQTALRSDGGRLSIGVGVALAGT